MMFTGKYDEIMASKRKTDGKKDQEKKKKKVGIWNSLWLPNLLFMVP